MRQTALRVTDRHERGSSEKKKKNNMGPLGGVNYTQKYISCFFVKFT